MATHETDVLCFFVSFCEGLSFAVSPLPFWQRRFDVGKYDEGGLTERTSATHPPWCSVV